MSVQAFAHLLTHLALRVRELDELLDRLKNEGFEMIESSHIESEAFESSGAFVLDPDGVRVELVEMPGDPRLPLGEPF